ncbi:MAG: sulfatase, partial [Verrucomicrobia bacterium]
MSLLDLYPTLVELCDLQGPETLDGQSLEPLLREPSRATGRVVTTTFDRGNISL